MCLNAFLDSEMAVDSFLLLSGTHPSGPLLELMDRHGHRRSPSAAAVLGKIHKSGE